MRLLFVVLLIGIMGFIELSAGYVEKPNLIYDATGRLNKIDYQNDTFDTTYTYGNSELPTILQSSYVTSRFGYDKSSNVSSLTYYIDGYVIPVNYTYVSGSSDINTITAPGFEVAYVHIHDEAVSTEIRPTVGPTISYGYGRIPSSGRTPSPLVTINDTSLIYRSDGLLLEDPKFIYEYNSDGLLYKKISKASGDSVINSYYNNGLLRRMTYPDFSWEDHYYDSSDYLIKVVYSALSSEGNVTTTSFYLIIPGLPDTMLTKDQMNAIGLQRYAINSCGNLVWEPSNNEECDDGNSNSGDGCSSDCKLETASALGTANGGLGTVNRESTASGSQPDYVLWAIVGILILMAALIIYPRIKTGNRRQ